MKRSEGILKAMAPAQQDEAKKLVAGLNVSGLNIPAPFKKLIVSFIDVLQEIVTPQLEKVNATLAFAFNTVCEAIENALK